MASIQQIKDALELERDAAFEVSQLSISAIATLLSLSQWVLTIVGIVLALAAIIGLVAIYRSTKSEARKVASRAIEDYIKSQDFQNSLETAVRTEVRDRVDGRVILNMISKESGGDEPDPFPKPEGKQP